MASLNRHSDYSFRRNAALKPQSQATGASGAARIAALSIEFVAKPQEAQRVETAIPEAIDSALKDVTGFAGSLLMTSEQEARLVTVVTLWDGEERVKHCRQNFGRVYALLTPYLDGHLRVQTMVAHFRVLPMVRPEAADESESSTMAGFGSEEETVCAG